MTNPNGISAHLGRLAGIAAAEPEFREDIGAYLEALRSVAPAMPVAVPVHLRNIIPNYPPGRDACEIRLLG